MADNFDFTPGTGGTGAADDIGGILYPRVKLIYGADGASSGDVSATNPLPVVVSSGTTAIVGTVTITGSTVIVGSVTVTGSTVIVGAVSLAQKTGKFNGSVTTTNCTTAVQVIAAVSATTTYITAYMISAVAAGSYWLEDGAGTALTPYHFFAANGGVSFSCDPSTPISTAITNTTIKVKSTVAGSTGCLVIGYQA